MGLGHTSPLESWGGSPHVLYLREFTEQSQSCRNNIVRKICHMQNRTPASSNLCSLPFLSVLIWAKIQQFGAYLNFFFL